MKRPLLAALACLAAFPALALDRVTVENKPATLGGRLPNPGATSVNDEALKKAQAQQEAKAKLWDAKMKKTMQGVCKGC